MTYCSSLLLVSKRIESTAQIAGKLYKSISSLVAYVINETYWLSGDMQSDVVAGYQLSMYLTLAVFDISTLKPFLWTLVENHLGILGAG